MGADWSGWSGFVARRKEAMSPALLAPVCQGLGTRLSRFGHARNRLGLGESSVSVFVQGPSSCDRSLHADGVNQQRTADYLAAGVLDHRDDQGGAWAQMGQVLAGQVQSAVGVFENPEQQRGHFARE